jgi:hypothetical protein
MRRILQKLLLAPLAIINWTMFLVGLGWAITFFVGETIEGLPPDSFDPFLKDLLGFLRKSSAAFLVGGAAGLFFSFTQKRTLMVTTGGVGSSGWLGLAALILLVQVGVTVLVAHPLTGFIRENIDLFMVLEMQLQTTAKNVGEMRLVAAGALLFGTGLAAGASLVCLIGAVCPLFYVLFNLEGTPRICLRSACLQIAWLTVLFYWHDLLQASEHLLAVPVNLDIAESAWFGTQKAAVENISRQLRWLLPGFLISATVIVLKARDSVGGATIGLSSSGAMVPSTTADAQIGAPIGDSLFGSVDLGIPSFYRH